MSKMNIYSMDIGDQNTDNDQLISSQVPETNVINNYMTVVNDSFDKFAILRQYQIELIFDPGSDELYSKYKGRLPMNKCFLDAFEILKKCWPISLSNNIATDPIINMISNCIHDFSMVVSNKFLVSIACLFDCISVYKDKISGFYYKNDVSFDNLAVNHLISYICYYTTGYFDKKDTFECCSYYVCKYIRELRLKCKLLEALGFEKVKRYDTSEVNKYLYIKVLTKKNIFHLYRRKDYIYSDLYAKYDDILFSDSDNEFVDLDNINGTSNDIRYIHASNIYNTFKKESIDFIKRKRSMNDKDFLDKLNKDNEKDNEVLNNHRSSTDTDLLNSLSNEIKKGFIQRLKGKKNSLDNIHCKINRSTSYVQSTSYSLKYNESVSISSEQFSIIPIEEANNVIELSFNTSMNDSTIDSSMNNTVENADDSTLSQEEVHRSENNELNNNSRLSNSDETNNNNSMTNESNEQQVSTESSSNTSVSTTKRIYNTRSGNKRVNI